MASRKIGLKVDLKEGIRGPKGSRDGVNQGKRKKKVEVKE